MTIQKALTDLAERINAEHAACMASARDAVARAIEVGRLLAEAKDQVRHGEWAAWVAENCSFGIRQAQKYMRAHDNRVALEDQMRTPGSHLTSLNDAIALVSEPWEPTDLERCEATIEAGLSELEGMGFDRSDVVPLLAEALTAVESPDWGLDDAKTDQIRSRLADVRKTMSSPGWPPGETTEDKLRNTRETVDIASKLQNAAAAQKIRAERDLGDLVAKEPGAPKKFPINKKTACFVWGYEIPPYERDVEFHFQATYMPGHRDDGILIKFDGARKDPAEMMIGLTLDQAERLAGQIQGAVDAQRRVNKKLKEGPAS